MNLTAYRDPKKPHEDVQKHGKTHVEGQEFDKER